MMLVDTSVWVDFFRRGNTELESLLESGQVLMHPFILGELACGHLKPRDQILSDLAELPSAVVAGDDEVLYCIEQLQLMGQGAGYLDMHLLISARLGGDVRLWTLDKKLSKLVDSVLALH